MIYPVLLVLISAFVFLLVPYISAILLQPYIDFTEFFIPLLALYFILPVVAIGIRMYVVYLLEPKDILKFSEDTILINNTEIQIVQSELREIFQKSTFLSSFFDELIITPNDSNPQSWMYDSSVTEKNQVCFVVNKTEDNIKTLIAKEKEIDIQDVETADIQEFLPTDKTIFYPESHYTLNSSYDSLEYLHIYTPQFKKICKYTLNS